MPKYINAGRREVIYWTAAMLEYYKAKKEHYSKKSLSWINSIIISLDSFLTVELKGADKDEMRAITNLVQEVRPELVIDNRVTSGEKTVCVSQEIIFDFAEYALEYCINCTDNPKGCRLKNMALTLGIPPYVEAGPCPYRRE